MEETFVEETAVTDEMKVKAVKNEWGKTFRLGDQEFEIKDLPYFDYIEFVQLARPLISAAASGIEMTSEGGELGVQFNPASLDMDKLIAMCGKELPRLAWLVCKQSDPKIKAEEVAILAHRPQRLLEVILLQVFHNKMIEEFGSFFTRLTAMVSALVPDVAKVAAPSEME